MFWATKLTISLPALTKLLSRLQFALWAAGLPLHRVSLAWRSLRKKRSPECLIASGLVKLACRQRLPASQPLVARRLAKCLKRLLVSLRRLYHASARLRALRSFACC